MSIFDWLKKPDKHPQDKPPRPLPGDDGDEGSGDEDDEGDTDLEKVGLLERSRGSTKGQSSITVDVGRGLVSAEGMNANTARDLFRYGWKHYTHHVRSPRDKHRKGGMYG